MDIEDVRRDAGRALDGMLECGLISYGVYMLLYRDEMAMIDTAYSIGLHGKAEKPGASASPGKK